MDPTQLALGEPVRQEVGSTGKTYYRQYLRHRGTKLVLLTPNYESAGLVFQTHGENKSVLVNIPPKLRSTLNVVEDFVTRNVTLPANAVTPSQNGSFYKSLWPAENVMITLSRWCKIYQLNYETEAYEMVPPDGPFGRGFYQFSFEVPYVYIGPHKEGQSFSLTLRVVQIVFTPHKERTPAAALPPTTDCPPTTQPPVADCLTFIADCATPLGTGESSPSQDSKKGRKKGKKNGPTALPLLDFE